MQVKDILNFQFTYINWFCLLHLSLLTFTVNYKATSSILVSFLELGGQVNIFFVTTTKPILLSSFSKHFLGSQIGLLIHRVAGTLHSPHLILRSYIGEGSWIPRDIIQLGTRRDRAFLEISAIGKCWSSWHTEESTACYRNHCT